MGSQERERVQVRISPERKKEWVEAVNEGSAYSNLSHLIIRSVEKELQEDEETQHVTGDVTADVDLSPVIEAVNEVGEQVTNVEKQITSIEAVAADSSKILDVSHDLIKYLPDANLIESGPIENAMEVAEPNLSRSEDVLIEDIEEHGRIDDIVELYTEHRGMDEKTVRLGIEKLKTDMNRVTEQHDRLVRET